MSYLHNMSEKDFIKEKILKLIERYSSIDTKGDVDAENFKDARLIGYRDILHIIEEMEDEAPFKIGDRIRVRGTNVKGAVITNIHKSETGNLYYEFKNSDDAPVYASTSGVEWELVLEG